MLGRQLCFHHLVLAKMVNFIQMILKESRNSMDQENHPHRYVYYFISCFIPTFLLTCFYKYIKITSEKFTLNKEKKLKLPFHISTNNIFTREFSKISLKHRFDDFSDHDS